VIIYYIDELACRYKANQGDTENGVTIASFTSAIRLQFDESTVIRCRNPVNP
jgi:hypothetical protein